MALTRGIHPDTLAAISGYFHPVTLVFVDWPGDPVRVHTGIGDLSWDSQTWTGIGPLNGALQLPGEAGGVAMIEGAASLPMGDNDIDALYADAGDARGQTMQVWFGAVTQRSGTTLIGEPFEIYRGRIGGISDSAEWTNDELRRLFTLALISGPSQRATGSATHSYEDQLRVDPTDTAGRLLRSAVANAVRTATRS